MALYRKYRPQGLDDIVGQESVKQALKSAVQSGKLAHAYLFCGPKGTGKTSTARILAKIVNCEKRIDSSSKTPQNDIQIPCNECESCLSITDGSNLDVVEMDAASNRGIEDIRALRDTIKLAPTKSAKKVYIIDEAHMLTGEAFNALLKTLEEPPAHVLFILATTEPQKIPQTILSRVQKLEFKQATSEDILKTLEKISQSEGFKIEKDVLLFLAKKAQGSFRDGVKLLDQVSSLESIDLASAESLFGISSFVKQIEIIESISESNTKKALEVLSEILSLGVQIKELNLSLLDILRSLMLIKNGVGEALVKGEVSSEEYETLVKLSDKFDLDKLVRTINSLQKSLEQLKYVSIVSLPLELAIVESSTTPVTLSEMKGISQELYSSGPKDYQNDNNKSNSDKQESRSESSANKTQIESRLDSLTDDVIKIQDKWGYILETVENYNFSLKALLRSAKVASCNDKVVVIEVPYSFHQRIMEAPKSKEVLESILSDILGRSIRVSTILGKSKVNREELANVEVAADDEVVRLAAEIFNSEAAN